MQRERRRGQWERLCQRFLCDSPRLLLGGGTRLSPSQGDRGGSQPLAVSRSIRCLLGSGVLMIHPGTSAELPHGRPSTAGFSVSGATLSVQASFLFFPGKEIRKKVTPPMSGTLTSSAWPLRPNCTGPRSPPAEEHLCCSSKTLEEETFQGQAVLPNV